MIVHFKAKYKPLTTTLSTFQQLMYSKLEKPAHLEISKSIATTFAIRTQKVQICEQMTLLQMEARSI